ncbi:MAG: NAD(P)-binding protein [Candidatus Hodarchaeales archaeon]
MDEIYDVFIAGGGLGGLLSSALLSREGNKCCLVEKLPFFGGRFTTHNYRGFEIPTGAVHMIPHSRNGILGKTLLNDLELPVVIKDTENFTTWYWNNRDPISHKRFWGIFKALPKWGQRYFVIRKLMLSKRPLDNNNESFNEYLSKRTSDPQLFQFFNAIAGFALSLNITEISAKSMFRFLDRLFRSGKAGVPIGGCKQIVNRLTDFSKSKNAVLSKNSQIIKFERNGQTLESVIIRNTKTSEEIEIKASHFIFNLGVPQINTILESSGLNFRLPVTSIAKGGGFAFRSKKSLLGKSTVAQFPECKYVKGAVEPTLISPELAPKNEHLFLTHQVFHDDNLKNNIKRARDEVFELFPSLREEDELCAHSFHREWPVNHCAQGSDNNNFSSVFNNLYFVGDGFKGNSGWFMSEGVTYGTHQVVNQILSRSGKS